MTTPTFQRKHEKTDGGFLRRPLRIMVYFLRFRKFGTPWVSVSMEVAGGTYWNAPVCPVTCPLLLNWGW